MLKMAVVVAALLVAVVIVYGTLQAEEAFNEPPVPPAEAVEEEPTPEFELAPAPPREYELTGSDILYRVSGSDDPCRFLYTGNRIGTHAGTELKVWFVAGVWEADLDYNDEMHLYGPNGPHLFEIEGPNGLTVLSLYVDRGTTEYATVTFPAPGMYYLFDRQRPELDIVGEITVVAEGQPGSGGGGDWCRP